MTSPLENIEALMPFKVVYVSQETGQWFDTTQGSMYRKLTDGMVYKISVTSYTSGSPSIHLSTNTNAASRIQSAVIPAGVENLRVKEAVVKPGSNRYISIVGSGTPNDEITVELIPMPIMPA